MPDTLKDQLEHIVDRSSVADVLTLLIRICEEKAEHIRYNWQDEPLARHWEAQARKLIRIKPQ